jgi:hypothetical protein
MDCCAETRAASVVKKRAATNFILRNSKRYPTVRLA